MNYITVSTPSSNLKKVTPVFYSFKIVQGIEALPLPIGNKVDALQLRHIWIVKDIVFWLFETNQL